MLLKLPWTTLAILVSSFTILSCKSKYNLSLLFVSINERQSTCVVSVAVYPSILKERGLGIKAQKEAHLFPSEVLALGCHAAVEGGERCEGRPGFLGPARLTVLCAPLQETTTVSLLQSTKSRDKNGLQRLERQQNVLSAEEMERQRQTEEGKSATAVCGSYLFWVSCTRVAQ